MFSDEWHDRMQEQKAAVQSGQWLLYRFNPEKTATGENPLHLDSGPPTIGVADYFRRENRFQILARSKPEESERFFQQAQKDADERRHRYEQLAALNGATNGAKP